MSYLVLSRKWRPQVFEELVGQDHVSHALISAIKQDRIASAYLFCGPRGTGKTSTARILAKALNCLSTESPTIKPCGKCQNCKEIAAGHSLDVVEIDGASNRGIDDIRQLRENVHYAPSNSRRKIYIIDEVHMLTREAFNALLKTLEEPPKHINFIFATTEPHKIMPTILSRCQRFFFRRIPFETIKAKLQEVCTAEGIDIDDSALELISKKADGGLRDAESLLDQVASATKDKISIELTVNVLGIMQSESTENLINSFVTHNMLDALIELKQLREQGIAPSNVILGLLETLHNVIAAKIGAKYDKLPSKINQIPNQVTLSILLRISKLLSKCLNEISYSPQPQLLLETLIIQIIHFDDGVDVQEILNYLHKGFRPEGPVLPQESKSSSIPIKPIKRNTTLSSKKIQKKTPSKLTKKTLVPTLPQKKWKPGEEKQLFEEFLHSIKDKLRLSTILRQSSIEFMDADTLCLTLPDNDSEWMHRNGKGLLQDLFSEFMNTRISIKLKKQKPVDKGSNKKGSELLFQDDTLNRILKEFKGSNLQIEQEQKNENN